MTGTRAEAAAGGFYPAHPGELAALVDRFLSNVRGRRPAGRLRALVAPHAGYAYSGAVAGAAFSTIASGTRGLRVALLGPSHFVPVNGAAVTGASAWRTPLGPVVVAAELRAASLAAGAVVDDGPHRLDHALEVELPFLQRRAGGALRILPVAVGDAAAAAAVIASLPDDVLVVVSSDLSHYHDDATARRLDRRTARAVLALDDAALGDLDACGVDALRGLLRHARAAGWAPALLDLRTSADASGETGRVVGYGAFVFAEPRATGRQSL